MGEELPGRLLDALGADHQGLISAHMGRELAADGAKLLRRCYHQHEIAGRNFAELGGGFDGWVERDAGQIERVPMRRVDLADGLRLIGPQDDVPTGAPRAHAKRRAPSTSPTIPNGLQRHVPAAN